ncbi:MAG: DUF5666 domain-containing protein [Chloroflexota bacterium]
MNNQTKVEQKLQDSSYRLPQLGSQLGYGRTLVYALIGVGILALSQFSAMVSPTMAAPPNQGTITIPTTTPTPTAEPPAVEPTRIRLVGPIQAQDDDNNVWTVAGVAVDVADSRLSERVGPAIVGAWVALEGEADGSGAIVAHRMKVLPVQRYVLLKGTLTGVSDAELHIGGIAVNIDANTRIQNTPEVGKLARIRAELEDDNSMLAAFVQVQQMPSDGDDGNDGDDGDDGEEDEEDEDEDLDDDPVVLVGVIQQLPDNDDLIGQWVVSGVTVNVDEETRVRRRIGPALIGSWVRVGGTGSNTASGASEIDARRVQTISSRPVHKLYGTVDSIGDDAITVSGIQILLDEETVIKGNLTEGTAVKIQAILVDSNGRVARLSQIDVNGQLKALRIVVRQNDEGNGENPNGEFRFIGLIDALPTDASSDVWMIKKLREGDEAQPIVVTENTAIYEEKAYVDVGAEVHVEGYMDAEGTSVATEIIVLEGANEGEDDEDGIYIELLGPVEMLPADNTLVGDWMVAGQTVKVSPLTEIDMGNAGSDGIIIPGTLVRVAGYMNADGDILARKIRVKEVFDAPNDNDELYIQGEVESRPAATTTGTWIVDGDQVEVDENTRIDETYGPAVIGVVVKVIGVPQPDGTILAGLVKTVPTDEADDVNNIYTRIQGIVEGMPPIGTISGQSFGEWKVVDSAGDEIRVNVTPFTFVDEQHGPVNLGTPVVVEGVRAIDGSIVAFRIASERVDEGPETLTFQGIVMEVPDSNDGTGLWIVQNNVGRLRVVTADASTTFPDGIPAIDSLVRIRGQWEENDAIRALEIEIKETEPVDIFEVRFQDEIMALPDTDDLQGEWQIGDWTVLVDEATVFELFGGEFEVGKTVIVEGIFEPANLSQRNAQVDEPVRDGVVRAFWIKTIEEEQRDWVRISAPIRELPNNANLRGVWRLGQWDVVVSRETELKRHAGQFRAGQVVWAEGWYAGEGEFHAVRIDATGENAPNAEWTRIQGHVLSTPVDANGSIEWTGTWEIDNWIVISGPNTEMKLYNGDFVPGAFVWVEGHIIPDEDNAYPDANGVIEAVWMKTLEQP